MRCDADLYFECEYVKNGECQLNESERVDCCPRRSCIPYD